MFANNSNKSKKQILYYGLKGKGPWELAGSPRIIHPFPEESLNWDKKRIEREFAVKPDDWKKLSIDSTDEIFRDAFLASEVETRRTPAFVYFRRSFAQIPVEHVEYSTTTYAYPSYASATGGELEPDFFRESPTHTTNLKITYTYYRTLNPGTAIPLLSAFKPTTNAGYTASFVMDFTTSSGITFQATNPSLTAYLALVTAKSFLRAEDDVFERWHGNIWRRVRKEVLAQ
jgi:hypothetical protein